mmetsp:Transcript_3092/g.8409  ORF Transcript_3092/g.8409 Transcript_3092/m.8409 type:complete len:100 (+) Transcript_3092:1025-1324(+)
MTAHCCDSQRQAAPIPLLVRRLHPERARPEMRPIPGEAVMITVMMTKYHYHPDLVKKNAVDVVEYHEMKVLMRLESAASIRHHDSASSTAPISRRMAVP